MNIVIVGGGNAAVTLMDFFTLADSIDVVGLADVREDAPGMVRAKELNIRTSTDMKELIERRNTEMVLEVTGSPKVKEIVIGLLRSDQGIMSADGAKIMCDVIAQQAQSNSEAAEKMSREFDALTERLEGAIRSVDGAFKNVEDVLRETEIVNFNARVEAVRAGESGKSFAVIVERMDEMMGRIRQAMGDISTAADETHKSLDGLNEAQEQLLKVFRQDAA